MTWEWSHTQDAYDNAEQNLQLISLEDLRIIYAEIKADKDGNFREKKCHKTLKKSQKLEKQELIDFIWDFAESQATCSNGGHSAYICPYECHSVSFDNEESYFDRVDICSAYALIETHYNVSDILQQRKSNIRRNMSTDFQLKRMGFKESPLVDGYFDNLSDNAKLIYLMLEKRYNFVD